MRHFRGIADLTCVLCVIVGNSHVSGQQLLTEKPAPDDVELQLFTRQEFAQPESQPSIDRIPPPEAMWRPSVRYGSVDFYLTDSPKLLETQAGLFVARGEELLPAPADPGNLQTDPFSTTTRLGLAYSLGSVLSDNLQGPPGPAIRFGGDGSTFARYDTGHIAGSGVFDPRQITLDGTPDVSKRGQFKLSRFSGNLMADLQNLTNGRIPQAQLYAEGSYITSYLGDADDEFFLRHAYARVAEVDVGADSGFSIEAGSLDTLISDYGAVPTTVEGVVPIGSIDRGTLNNDKSARHQLQIRMRYRFSNRLEAGLAIEQPTNRDFVTAPGDTVLDRAPDVLARLRYVGADGWDTYHIAAIVRTFAVEDAADVEYVATGWGVSGLARMKNAGNTSAAYVGVAGGNGIGANIFGLDTAAVREMGSIQTFPAIGGYVGFAQQILPPDESEQSSLWSNFCYGIVATDLSNALALQNRGKELQQAWANLIWQVNANTAVALEYHYGMREVNVGTQGDNHRIQLVIQIGTSSPARSYHETTSRRAGDPGAPYMQRL